MKKKITVLVYSGWLVHAVIAVIGVKGLVGY